MAFCHVLFLMILCIQSVFANTEKLIFTAPEKLQIPTQHPTIENLKLEVLSPEQWSLRTHLQAEFPSNFSLRGKASWVLLQDLQEGQRYEVRICWAATQPTSFHINGFEIPLVFETPALISSLAEFSESRQSVEAPESHISSKTKSQSDMVSSMLLLQIHSAADYYTMNKTMMDQVPPVLVDIILDPYLLNIFPRSLVPTAGFILALAIGSWFLSGFISSQLHRIVRLDEQKKKS